MKSTRLILSVGVTALFGVLLTAGCNSTANRKWLTFFFDGVPSTNQTTNTPVVASADLEANRPAELVPKPAPAPFYYAHPPFADQKCTSCHEAGLGQGMKKKSPALCFDCHKDFLATAKVKHQPVESGDCKSCHDPHQSDKNKMLLLKTGKALCFDCHDNFLEKAKFKHDVADDCATCHNPHQSGESKLLLKNISKLCFDCHEEKNIKAVKGHANTESKSCVDCHDPHVGTDKNLLKPGKNPAAPK